MSDLAADVREDRAFDFSGGALCLDFANTVSGRAGEAPPVERLRSYGDLVAWARQAGVLGEREATVLARRGAESPETAAGDLAGAITLRETLFRLFAAGAAGERPAPADLAALNERLPGALALLRIAPAGDGFAWCWSDDSDGFAPMLAPVVRSAAELLTGPDLAAVRECAADTCRWLFLDRSRNRSRRWCDMKVCGNRAKARRYYRRQAANAPG